MTPQQVWEAMRVRCEVRAGTLCCGTDEDDGECSFAACPLLKEVEEA
jgi:hypothetical protein